MFKVGDTVRRVWGQNAGTPIGYVGVIRGVHSDEQGVHEYRFDGGAWGYADWNGAKWELVTSAPIGPVVTETVTKTRIVPGVYGRLVVQEDCDGYISVAILRTGQTVPSEEDFRSLTAPDLDAAAAVLSALAKGLRHVD